MKTFRCLAACAGLALLVGGCGGGGGIGGTGIAQGTVRVSITDAPACGYDHVYVTVQKVRVHQSATAADSDAGWSEVVLAPARRIDLLTLTNGVLDELGQTPLPAGRYTQLRLVLAANDAVPPLENAVVPTGSVDELALDTPSAQQSGLKMNVDLDVPANKVLDVVLDFDACKSVVRAGNSGRYNLKPVISATSVLSDAGLRVVGWIAPAAAASAPSVSVQASGVPVKATVPDATTGRFVLYPVPVGTYDLVVSGAGRVTAVMTGVPVVDTAYTYVNSATVPIAPPVPASAPGAVTGNVNPATATVRALQALTGGPTIEAAWIPVDALTGNFTYALLADAPLRIGYTLNPTSLPFSPDAAVAGHYTVEAASAGLTKSAPFNVAAPAPLNFTFP